MIDPLKKSGLRWGFSTLGCTNLSFAGICALAEEFGIEAVELRGMDGRLDLPACAEEQGLSARRIQELCRRHRLELVVAGSSVKLTSVTDADRQELMALSEWAHAVGIPYIRVFGGGVWGRAVSEAEYANAVDCVNWWRAERRQHGWQVELLLETHDAFSASEPCLEINRRLDEPLFLIWDSHHTWRLAGEAPAQSWSQIGALVRHVHVKDSIDRPSARHPYTYVLPGRGEMPLAELIDLLDAHGFGGCVSLEWERHWHSYLPPIQDALAELRRQPWCQVTAGEPRAAALTP